MWKKNQCTVFIFPFLRVKKTSDKRISEKYSLILERWDKHNTQNFFHRNGIVEIFHGGDNKKNTHIHQILESLQTFFFSVSFTLRKCVFTIYVLSKCRRFLFISSSVSFVCANNFACDFSFHCEQGTGFWPNKFCIRLRLLTFCHKWSQQNILYKCRKFWPENCFFLLILFYRWCI